ncbi:hypothetical protein B0H14DRAFT_3727570 [Mycena olivaceomarginata]|nr:hypothetical protein B0H14DRAFT_3727570 [Mycena olivaceomarginata]
MASPRPPAIPALPHAEALQLPRRLQRACAFSPDTDDVGYHCLNFRYTQGFSISTSRDSTNQSIGVTIKTNAGSSVFLSHQCAQILVYPQQVLQNSVREDMTFIFFQFWLLGVSVFAVSRGSIPHMITALASRFLIAAWSGYIVIYRTKKQAGIFREIVSAPGTPCGVELFPTYFTTRHAYDIADAILSFTALFLASLLSWNILKVFKAHLWADVLSRTAICLISEHTPIYNALVTATTVLVIPWITLGWYGVRREQKGLIISFLAVGFFFISGWAIMFYSIVYRCLGTPSRNRKRNPSANALTTHTSRYTPPPAAGPSVPPSSPPHVFQVPAHAQQQQQRSVQLKRSDHPVRRTLSTTTSLLPPPASVPAARCSAAVLPLRAPSTPLPRCSPPNNCIRIARLCASTSIRAAMAAASTRRACPVLSPRRCCAFSPCAARPILSHPRRPPPMPVLCAGVPSPAPSICVPRFNANVLPSCLPFLAPRHARHTRTHLATAPVPHACPVAPRRRALSACPFSPPTPLPHVLSPPVPAFGAFTVVTLSNHLRAPTATSTPTTPYPLPSPAALPAPAAARTTSPPSSLAGVLPAHLMNIYANPVPHATSPRRCLPAGALPDCIQHRSCTQPQPQAESPCQCTQYMHLPGTSVPYVRLTQAETYTPPPAAGRSVLPQSLPHAFQAPAHAQQQQQQQQQRPMEFKRSVSAMGVYHAHEHEDHPRAQAGPRHCMLGWQIMPWPTLRDASLPSVRTSATSTDGTFKRLHRRTMTPMLEPEPAPVFHPLHLCPSHICPLLSVVTDNKVSVSPPPSTNRIVGLDMCAPSSLTFGSRSSEASGEDEATLHARTGGLPPVFTAARAALTVCRSHVLGMGGTMGGSDASGYEVQELDASNPDSDIPYEIIEHIISCHSTSPSHYNIPKPAATLPGPLPHPPARKASTTRPTALTVFPTCALTCP